jgi:hypothetical protein
MIPLGTPSLSRRHPPVEGIDPCHPRPEGHARFRPRSVVPCRHRQQCHVQRVKAGFSLMLGAGLLSGLLGIGSGAMKVIAMDQIMRIPGDVGFSQSSFVDLATMCNARNADEHRCIVDDVYHPPVTDSDAPLVFVAFQFLRSSRPWGLSQRISSRTTRASSSSDSASSSFRAGALLRRNTYARKRPRFTRSALIFSSGMPFSFGVTLKSARPKNPLTPLRIVSGRFEPLACGPPHRLRTEFQ